MSRIPNDIINSQSEYMQLFGAEKESFAAGARWAEKFLESRLKAEAQATLDNILSTLKDAEEKRE